MNSDHNVVGVLLLAGGVLSIMRGYQDMSDYNWCHGPECHEKRTVDRVRGTKGNKVLRTRKVSLILMQVGTTQIVLIITFVVKLVKMIFGITWQSNKTDYTKTRGT